jgi:hypothetical protein
MNQSMNEGDLYVVNPEFFKCLYARVIDASGGNGLVYFSDGTSCLDFQEIHQKWVKTDQKLAYLAGPMRGYYRYNCEAFDRHDLALKNIGYHVINPSKVDADIGFDPRELPEDTDWNQVPFGFKLQRAIARCTVGVAMSDALFLMDGWQDSRGALAELQVARWAGIPVLELFEVHEGDAIHFYSRVLREEAEAAEEPAVEKAESRPESFTIGGAVRQYCKAFFNSLAREE